MKKKTDNVAILMAVKLAVIVLFLVSLCAISSCTPKSARTTKAVIIDSKPGSVLGTWNYKLAYLEYGVVDFKIDKGFFDVGDTIFVHDKYQGRNIK